MRWESMRKFLRKHRELWISSTFATSFVEGLLLLAASVVANHFASAYADIWASNSVTDIILDNVPALDVDGFLGIGALFFGISLLGTCLVFPRSIPFVLKSVALFILIRSMFLVLTHLGPSPDKVALDDGALFSGLLSGNDLFFSGHTGLPFLIALLFWDIMPVRVAFLSMSIAFAIGVLAGHLHYSIDVFSAFFITYSIFCLAKNIFPEARKWHYSRRMS